MTKREFLMSLANKLDILTYDEKGSALRYYEEFIDDAGAENEEETISRLGAPEKLANEILANLGIVQVYENNTQTSDNENYQSSKVPNQNTKVSQVNQRNLGIIILILATSPLWAGILTGLIAGFFGVAIGLIVAVFTIGITGVALIFIGILKMTLLPALGMLYLGIGLVLSGICWLLIIPIIKLTFRLVKWVFNLFARLFRLIFKSNSTIAC